MMKIFVKYGYYDNYNRLNKANAVGKWFNTTEDAEKFITAEKNKVNGYRFHVYEVAELNYTEYLEHRAWTKQMTTLVKPCYRY